DGLLHFGSQCDLLIASAAVVIGLVAAVVAAAVIATAVAGIIRRHLAATAAHACLTSRYTCFVGGHQVRRKQIVGEPEVSGGIHGKRIEIIAVGAVPRIAGPAPAVVDGRGPRIVRPAVVSGTIPVSRRIAVIRVAVIVVAGIGARVVVAVTIVRASPVRIAAPHIRVVYVAVTTIVADRPDVLTASIDVLGANRPRP